MPSPSDGLQEILANIEQNGNKHEEQLVYRDACIDGLEEVVPDSKDTDEHMVKTVPYAIAIPNIESVDADQNSDRFTPVTERSQTPGLPDTVDGTLTPGPADTAEEALGEEALEEEEDILIPSRPSSASPLRMRSAGKEKQREVKLLRTTPVDKPEVLELPLPQPKTVRKPMSFKELTADFDRMLKPLSSSLTQAAVSYPDAYYYDTSGDCCHPVLAIAPRNPATPPKSFKIHKQRTVLKPGYSYVEPVLLDLPVSPDALTPDGIARLIDMANNMRPLPPRIDNFSHYPPSIHLNKPPFYVPRPRKPSRIVPGRKPFDKERCSTSKIQM